MERLVTSALQQSLFTTAVFCLTCAQAVLLTLVVGLRAVHSQESITDPDSGDDPTLADMIAARERLAARDLAARSTTALDDMLPFSRVFNVEGTEFLASDDLYESMRPQPNTTVLNISNALWDSDEGLLYSHGMSDYNAIPWADRPSNNLGGQGPNNGMYCYKLGAITLDFSAKACSSDSYFPDNSNYQAHPNFIRLNGVTTLTNGDASIRRVGLRIDNTTEYRAAKPAMNDFNGFNFQVNMQPIFDPYAGIPADANIGFPGAYQPFKAHTGLMSQGPFVLDVDDAADKMFSVLLNVSLAAENMNKVDLFYSFFDQDTGDPVELDEVNATLLTCAPLQFGLGPIS